MSESEYEINTDRCPRCETALSQKQLEEAFPSSARLTDRSPGERKAETLSTTTCDGCGADLEHAMLLIVERGGRARILTTVGVLDGWVPDTVEDVDGGPGPGGVDQ